MTWIPIVTLFILTSIKFGHGLDNGLALTPPMGWLTWERFRCTTNCTEYPDECISEKLIKEMADHMANDGYAAAGYKYIIIDDCWLAKDRDQNNHLQEDKERFPSGIPSLATYVHSKGLLFGIYEDFGTKTCAGYPGIKNHLKGDAELFAKWNVDYLKIDGCYSSPLEMDEGYIEFGNYLNATRKPIVYSCSWPFYQQYYGITPNYSLISHHCNLWRNYDDIQDSWSSVTQIIKYFGDHQAFLAQHSGPGHWNDPDMLIIGNYGLSYEQAKAQMAIWCILAAPLIMSHDLRNVRPEFRDILLNKGAISINQDELGMAGTRKYKENSIEFWTKPLKSEKDPNLTVAVAILSLRDDGAPYKVSAHVSKFQLDPTKAYEFTEVFDSMKPFNVPTNGTLTVRVPPTGALLFKVRLKASLEERADMFSVERL